MSNVAASSVASEQNPAVQAYIDQQKETKKLVTGVRDKIKVIRERPDGLASTTSSSLATAGKVAKWAGIVFLAIAAGLIIGGACALGGPLNPAAWPLMAAGIAVAILGLVLAYNGWFGALSEEKTASLTDYADKDKRKLAKKDAIELIGFARAGEEQRIETAKNEITSEANEAFKTMVGVAQASDKQVKELRVLAEKLQGDVEKKGSEVKKLAQDLVNRDAQWREWAKKEGYEDLTAG